MGKLNQAGIDLIKRFEGCRLTAYKPVAAEKYWTIGYGHYGADVTPGMKITQVQADTFLANDLPRYADALTPLVKDMQLNDNQFSALVSFCYNCGAGGFASSTGYRLMKAGQLQAGIDALGRWNKGADGKVLLGLTRRRAAEKDLFNTPMAAESALP